MTNEKDSAKVNKVETEENKAEVKKEDIETKEEVIKEDIETKEEVIKEENNETKECNEEVIKEKNDKPEEKNVESKKRTRVTKPDSPTKPNKIKKISISCVVEGESNIFSVSILPNKTINQLKHAIKMANKSKFNKFDFFDLTLWRVTGIKKNSNSNVDLKETTDKTELSDWGKVISEIKELVDPSTTIVVKLPQKDTTQKRYREMDGDESTDDETEDIKMMMENEETTDDDFSEVSSDENSSDDEPENWNTGRPTKKPRVVRRSIVKARLYCMFEMRESHTKYRA
ncbi:hypothetical protein BGZ76_010788 [Entomortierella beljakovae]|nr:hypothetical protein BGZ76_010788 [Entomortierella beljakovae]